MASMIEYIMNWWKRLWAIKAEDKFPAVGDHQREYRNEFGDIVDQYLIFYKNEEIKGKHYKSIVYIDAEDDIDWIDKSDNLSEEEMRKRNQYISKLDVVHALPMQNLSKEEIINFKKILGVGYAAALYKNWGEVDMAIVEAKKYRDDRNKERSRLMLLGAATFYLGIVVSAFLLSYHWLLTHPHVNLIWGTICGVVGAYVSIWTRYGKMDMTGLGTPSIHYLEAFARMLIGAIFAIILIFALKSGIIFESLTSNASSRLIYGIIGFGAGFSEKLVPSVMEHFVTNTTN